MELLAVHSGAGVGVWVSSVRGAGCRGSGGEGMMLYENKS